MGVADLGIVGLNEVAEKGFPRRADHGPRVRRLPPLAGRAQRTAAYEGLAITSAAGASPPPTPTSSPGYFAEKGIDAEIHTIEGSVEIAPAVGMADAHLRHRLLGRHAHLQRAGRGREGPLIPRRCSSPARGLTSDEAPRNGAADLPPQLDPRQPRHEIRADEPPQGAARRRHPAYSPACAARRCCRWRRRGGARSTPSSPRTSCGSASNGSRRSGPKDILILALENMIR